MLRRKEKPGLATGLWGLFGFFGQPTAPDGVADIQHPVALRSATLRHLELGQRCQLVRRRGKQRQDRRPCRAGVTDAVLRRLRALHQHLRLRGGLRGLHGADPAAHEVERERRGRRGLVLHFFGLGHVLLLENRSTIATVTHSSADGKRMQVFSFYGPSSRFYGSGVLDDLVVWDY